MSTHVPVHNESASPAPRSLPPARLYPAEADDVEAHDVEAHDVEVDAAEFTFKEDADEYASEENIDANVDPAQVDQLHQVLRALATDARVEGRVKYAFNEVRKKFVLHVAFPVEKLPAIVAAALGLEQGHAVVLEVHLGWQHLTAASLPKPHAVYLTPSEAIGAADSTQKSVGALDWFLRTRLEAALAFWHQRIVHGDSDADTNAAPDDLWADGGHNIFVGLAAFLERRLRTCGSVCVICDDPLPSQGSTLATCNKALCTHSAEVYGLGIDIAHELEYRAHACKQRIARMCLAAMQGHDLRCPVHINASAFPGYDGPTHFYEAEFGVGVMNVTLLAEHIKKLPSVPAMTTMAAGNEATLRAQLNVASPLLFPLLRWILATAQR